ncbi:MAG TPA: DUF4432 family protein [Planctomycetota bacterium]|nr:DUF4432 family protein [Planctomycetota bacterium]
MKLAYSRTSGARVTDEMSFRDMRLLTLENERIRVTLNLDKGSDVVEFLDKRTDTDFMWKTPNGMRSPKSEPNSLGPLEAFNAYYEGGWQELFPHGSSPLEVHGVTLPRHGEVQALPWKHAIVKDTADEVQVKLWVRTVLSPFLVEKTLTINATDPWVRFDERATNLGTSEFTVMWGHHPAFGEPFLSGDCTIELPEGRVVSGDLSMCRIPPRDVKPSGNMWYLTDFDAGWYGIRNAKRDAGFGMKWDATFFPVIWIWQGYNDGNFGRTYACAIEPFTSFAEANYKIRGRVPVSGGATLATSFHAFSYTGKLAETLAKLD